MMAIKLINQERGSKSCSYRRNWRRKIKTNKNNYKTGLFYKVIRKNARAHKSRINTDLPGGKAVAKSIFRHYTKGQKVINHRKGNSVRRHTKDNRIQIRMVKRKDGTWKVNLDIKRKRIYEDIHFKYIILKF